MLNGMPKHEVTLDENCVHFIHGQNMYAAHQATGHWYLVQFNADRRVTYTGMQYEELPEQVRIWWSEYRDAEARAGAL